MIINRYNRIKLKVLSFIMIIMVLYVHSYYLEAIDTQYASFVQVFMGNGGISNVAVPLFFAMSGFLFFNDITKISDCFPKIKKRVKTLLIPYIIWNIVFILWYVILQNLPVVKDMVNSDMIAKITSESLSSSLYELFVVPASFPLWFLRDLIIIVMLSPLLFLLLKYMKWIGVIMLIILTPLLQSLTDLFNQFGIAYFALGGAIAMYYDLDSISARIGKIPFILCLSITLAHAVMAGLGFNLNTAYWGLLSMLSGMVVIWKGYDWIASNQSLTSKLSSLNSLLGYSFFVYLFHEPAFNIIKKLGLKVFGVHEWSLILLYLINPLIMCAVSIIVAKVLQRLLPRAYSVLVGGR